MLAGVVGRGCRRVATVVGCQHQQVARLERIQEIRKPAVEILEAVMEVDRVVATPPEHVRLDEVQKTRPLPFSSRMSRSVVAIPSMFDFVGWDSSMS